MNNKENFKRFAQTSFPGKISDSVFNDYVSKQEQNAVFNPSGYQSPYILEEHEVRATSMDIFSRLLMDRQIFFASEVSDETASVVIAQLLYLDNVSHEDITMYVLSPGGSCSAGMGIIDTMGFIKSDIRTINVGMAASMGVMIQACGTRGKRQTLPHARFLIHQPLISGGGITGPTDDVEIQASEMKKLKVELFSILAQRTGKTLEQITKDAARDYWLNAEEALEYGLVDEIIKIDWD